MQSHLDSEAKAQMDTQMEAEEPGLNLAAHAEPETLNKTKEKGSNNESKSSHPYTV